MQEGSIKDVTARLRLWCSRPGRGLARVEWDSAYSRRELVKRLREGLADVAVTELEVPSDGTPYEDVDQLLGQLATVEGGVVSITGVEGVFPDNQRRLETLSALSFQRETLTSFPLRQIWWIPSHLTELLVLGVPDLDSWFQLRLHLTEVLIPEIDPRALDEMRKPKVPPEEARALAQRFWDRLTLARERDVSEQQIWNELAWPAIEALYAARLFSEADDILAEIPNIRDAIENRLRNRRASEGPLSPEALNTEEQLASVLTRQNALPEALAMREHVLAARRKQLGDLHQDTLLAMVCLVETLIELEDFAASRRLAEEILTRSKQLYGDEHRFTLMAIEGLAEILREQGDLSGAQRLEREVAEIRERQAREQVSQAQ